MTQWKAAMPIIPEDIPPQAQKIIASFFGGQADLASNVTALIADMISFGMAAERSRAADMAASVSPVLASQIWSQA
jgi:hypothetical protein